MSEHPHQGGAVPSEPDQRALDALVDAGWDIGVVAPELKDRAEHVLGLLAALREVGHRADRVLVDVAFLKAMRQTDAPAEEAGMLHPADEEAIDAWMLSGFDAARVPSSLRSRVRQHEAISSLIAGTVPQGSDRGILVDRTMQAVESVQHARTERMRIAPDRGFRGRRIRFNDLVSLAAMLLIGTAVALPIMSSTRAHMRQTLCQANLGSTALALASYAAANRDSLPVANAGFQGGTWWNVGKDRNASNSANLFSLVAEGYADLKDLACPGNPKAVTEAHETLGFDWRQLEQVSYSYRLIPAGTVPRVHDDPQAVILADRSPVVLMAAQGLSVRPEDNSPNHGGRGQHLLFGDGSAQWAKSPVLEDTGDNIWLPRIIENKIRSMQGRPTIEPIQGNELPTTPMDVFLGP